MTSLAKSKITINVTAGEYQTLRKALFNRRYSIKEDLSCGCSGFVALDKTERLIRKFERWDKALAS